MKTIVLTLHAANTFRNIFLPPNSVIDRLSKNKNLKIILVVASSIKNLLEIQHSDRMKDKNIILEVVGEFKPKSFLERSFYFFYSYLIFTTTTKTLATWGVRADAPPAGGNRYISVIKAAIASTFGKSKWIKRKFIPWMFLKIFRKRPHKALFDKYNPDLVFLSNIAHFPDQEILAEAKRRKIRTLGMASNWDHFNKYFIAMKSDEFLAQNKAIFQESVDLQVYEKEKVKIVGFAQFDPYEKIEKYTDSKDEFLKRVKAEPGAKFILFIAGSVHYAAEPDAIRALLKWINQGEFGDNTYLFIRTYPGVDMSKFKEFMDNPRFLYDTPPTIANISGMRYFFNQMCHADIIISIYSTTLLEAAIFDKPLVTLGFDGNNKIPFCKSILRAERMAHIKHLIDDGYVTIARSFDDLYFNIKRYIENPKQDRDKREKLVEKMCYKIDGLASKRISDYILEAVT